MQTTGMCECRGQRRAIKREHTGWTATQRRGADGGAIPMGEDLPLSALRLPRCGWAAREAVLGHTGQRKGGRSVHGHGPPQSPVDGQRRPAMGPADDRCTQEQSCSTTAIIDASTVTPCVVQRRLSIIVRTSVSPCKSATLASSTAMWLLIALLLSLSLTLPLSHASVLHFSPPFFPSTSPPLPPPSPPTSPSPSSTTSGSSPPPSPSAR